MVPEHCNRDDIYWTVVEVAWPPRDLVFSVGRMSVLADCACPAGEVALLRHGGLVCIARAGGTEGYSESKGTDEIFRTVFWWLCRHY